MLIAAQDELIAVSFALMLHDPWHVPPRPQRGYPLPGPGSARAGTRDQRLGTSLTGAYRSWDINGRHERPSGVYSPCTGAIGRFAPPLLRPRPLRAASYRRPVRCPGLSWSRWQAQARWTTRGLHAAHRRAATGCQRARHGPSIIAYRSQLKDWPATGLRWQATNECVALCRPVSTTRIALLPCTQIARTLHRGKVERRLRVPRSAPRTSRRAQACHPAGPVCP